MKKTTGLLVLAIVSSLLAADAKPARAMGVGCWYELHYYAKNWGGCFPQGKNTSGQIIHICCG